jgi:hypothetical protein
VGAARVAEGVVAAWRTLDDPRDRLGRFAFLDAGALDDVIERGTPVSPASVAFLLDLEALALAADAMARTPRPRPAAAGTA